MFTASIVTYRTPAGELDTCLKALDTPLLDTLFIVDNARSEQTRLWAQGKDKVVYIPAENRGYGAGHNQALRRVLGRENPPEFHLVMNSDLYFTPSDIESIHAFMASRPDVGTLQPRIVGVDGEMQHTCRLLPTPFDLIARRFLPRGWFGKSRQKYLLAHLDPDREWNVPYHQGSFMFLRTRALRDVGLFDERFFMYPEDIDLTRRLHRRYVTLYWPGVTVEHRHGAASYKSVRMLKVHVLNMIKYFNKWGWIFDSERRRFNAPLLEDRSPS